MMFRLLPLVLFFAVAGFFNLAGAVTESQYIYRTGYASNFCSGSNGYFCIDGIKQAAKRDAERSADIDCRIRRGVLEAWGASCFDSCNPSNLPYNAPLQNVSCNSSCTFTCKITK